MNQADHDEIASIARRIWEDAGKPANQAASHWHQAEAEFMRKQRQSPISSTEEMRSGESPV